MNDLYIDIGEYGRGVFSSSFIKHGAIIEQCPLIELEDGADLTLPLKYYVIELTAFNAQFLILGYGSLYNHSLKPNAEITDVTRSKLCFRALKDIPPHSEILFDYAFENDVPDFMTQKER